MSLQMHLHKCIAETKRTYETRFVGLLNDPSTLIWTKHTDVIAELGIVDFLPKVSLILKPHLCSFLFLSSRCCRFVVGVPSSSSLSLSTSSMNQHTPMWMLCCIEHKHSSSETYKPSKLTLLLYADAAAAAAASSSSLFPFSVDSVVLAFLTLRKCAQIVMCSIQHCVSAECRHTDTILRFALSPLPSRLRKASLAIAMRCVWMLLSVLWCSSVHHCCCFVLASRCYCSDRGAWLSYMFRSSWRIKICLYVFSIYARPDISSHSNKTLSLSTMDRCSE